ncbi:hypothetical protein [Actinoplanes solisilvae]|uniref:hypothetical protein n=1 Tax=Actinoplanes solisilvae TaxID=2486853 RepID=UPI000FDB86CC|nr:hypothetical protein [Actinoplanes solisilvae]
MSPTFYELDERALARHCAAAIAAHPATGRFLALALGPSDPTADVVRTIEPQLQAVVSSNREHEKRSIFLLVLDRRTGLPAAAGRVVDGGGRALDDAPERIGRELSAIVDAHELHEGKIWDVATLGNLSGYRDSKAGLTVSALLARTLVLAGHRAGVRHLVGLLDQRTHRTLALLGVPFVPMAGSEASSRALYAPFPALEPAIAEQGRRLNRLAGSFTGEIEARGLRRLVIRRLAARMSEQVATGQGLDEHILLPGLERRRYRGLRKRG